MSIEAMKQALERMKGVRIFVNSKEKIKQPEGAEWFEEGIKVLEEAIAEAEKQEQPPIGFITNARHRLNFEPNATGLKDMPKTIDWKIPVYASPQPRTWVGLTDEEENELWESTDSDWELMKRVEAKLKELNT